MQPTLLILAAGKGSRYGGLKQLDEVGLSGETIMDYSIFDAVRAGYGKVVFVIRREFETEFREKIADKWASRISVDFAYQDMDAFVPVLPGQVGREKPWGTGHAVLVAREAVDTPFVVINADDYYGPEGFRKMASFLTTDSGPTEYAMVGYVLRNTISEHGTVSRGICSMDESFLLQSVRECTGIEATSEGIVCQDGRGGLEALSAEALVSMNLWGFHPHIFSLLEEGFREFVAAHLSAPKAEFYLSTFANELIADGRATFTVLPNDSKWYGVTYREDKAMVQAAFREMTESGQYPTPLWNGLSGGPGQQT
jgi:NDP-sugar pyrophosphorylase family protein